MSSGKTPPALSEEERRIFRDALGGVRPLPAPPEPPRAPPPKPVAHMRERERRRVMDESLHGNAARWPDTSAGEEALYARPGIQRRVLERLRRGRYVVAEEIDLHGLHAREATVALAAFLNRLPRRERAVCVRVIHGKGRRSPQGAVLRPLVATWLSRREDVLAFATAPESEGGSGALYVLLRRS
ncbi:MAG: Smr/MutS family protein [Gammaproteobacteria bacterium]|nr:Smr/MutS family protein [Gammaproteobacteria bacterium]